MPKEKEFPNDLEIVRLDEILSEELADNDSDKTISECDTISKAQIATSMTSLEIIDLEWRRAMYRVNDSPQRSHTCLITAEGLYNFSHWEELISTFKVSIWVLMTVTCGIGYEGRLMISKWFGILEGIYLLPASMAVVSVAYTAFDIVNKSLHTRLVIIMILLWHSVLTAAIWLDKLIYGILFDCCLGSCYQMATYAFCSRQFLVRPKYFLIWVVGTWAMFCVIIFLLFYKFWTVLVIITVPADLLLTRLAVHATKTCDRLGFLQAHSILYCCMFESYRFMCLVFMVYQEKQWTFTLGRFCVLDFFCSVIMKGEVPQYIKKKVLGTSSLTHQVAERVNRGCVNVTVFCFPIWWLGFNLGRFLMATKVNVFRHVQLVLITHYAVELGSELAQLFINKFYSDCTDYEVRRVNFIPHLEKRLFIAAYGIIPSILLMILVLLGKDN